MERDRVDDVALLEAERLCQLGGREQPDGVHDDCNERVVAERATQHVLRWPPPTVDRGCCRELDESADVFVEERVKLVASAELRWRATAPPTNALTTTPLPNDLSGETDAASYELVGNTGLGIDTEWGETSINVCPRSISPAPRSAW